MMDELLLLTPESAARKLSIGRSAIFALLANGELESIRLGRSRRIPAAALAQFVQRRREIAKADGAAVAGS